MEATDILLPPVLPELKDQLENYLLDTESLPIHEARYNRAFYPYLHNPRRLFNPSLNPINTYLEVERDPATGHIKGVKESLNKNGGTTSKNSFSMQRIPGQLDIGPKGSSANYPFWPGGIPEPKLFKDFVGCDIDRTTLLKKHPKLSRGLEFEENKNLEKVPLKYDEINIADILKINNDFVFTLDSEEKKNKSDALHIVNEKSKNIESDVLFESLHTLKEKSVINISKDEVKDEYAIKRTEWAVMVNINSPVDDFSIKVPNLAHNFPFELDIFQKQAILCLEKHDSVFVAAHTSAGKTVIAEYAIALALKHMTKAIYTSPIKALSNQKYRDLKLKFEDVGLLTGDIQINSKASCLIMTTEILQSMLYNGSDTIRDLEWVIFDEVHYINNVERGHVWEEVIIMLPSHVNIVLLSATVPNTLQFADWIGRIKKRVIYVISTTKRPVPLEHYLYDGSTNEKMFMLINAQGKFLTNNYDKLRIIKKEAAENKKQKLQGPKQRTHLNEKQEKNMWIGLIDYLRKRELLPVVAFTLSKKRCDQNAVQLISQDLTTQREKGEIHAFIKKCTDRLQGSDKILPQVIHMTNILKKGIGVHHGGILPILKEVVEMLFAKGLVKLLFATETFSMGVNMPARCVVFDSIRKHDGTEFRDLLPSEYIQMAGRAGRRGLDTTGTVVILCKSDVPEIINLQKMMLGKPTKLESQFQLTYAMILNLLRVEALRVEDMMKRSFSESLQLQNQSKYEVDLKTKEQEINQMETLDCMMCSGMETLYGVIQDYLYFQNECLKIVHFNSNAKKLLQPGRIIKISYKNYQNFIACLLKVDSRNNKFYVFILTDTLHHEETSSIDMEMKACLAVCEDKIFFPEKIEIHKLLEIAFENVTGISTKVVRVDFDKVIDNIKKREIPRFKNDPPGNSVKALITELHLISESKESLEFINFLNDLNIRDFQEVATFNKSIMLKDRLDNHASLQCPQFSSHFEKSFKRMHLLQEIAQLKYLMSEEALQLHPEYQIRIEILKQLGYIEEHNTVTLKGRVACEMGNHELMVTELLLENVLADKTVEEMTAILSSLVFPNKKQDEPESKEKNLLEGIKQFIKVATKIGKTQTECGLKETVGDYVDQFNFGLCEVVYQWSNGMPFNKIMELTDIQEGIVVKTIQRLDETLRDVRNAARIIGDPNLYEKMELASNAIKRDIVFSASLYTQ